MVPKMILRLGFVDIFWWDTLLDKGLYGLGDKRMRRHDRGKTTEKTQLYTK